MTDFDFDLNAEQRRHAFIVAERWFGGAIGWALGVHVGVMLGVGIAMLVRML